MNVGMEAAMTSADSMLELAEPERIEADGRTGTDR